ncbi:MAG: cytochrome c oxidase assembly protein [Chloroflexota bacterium]|nr:cytochrome c oxidase assembly protein [Anaerolineales bacterium]MCA9978932.1 cytochrome c oxidase assembly protein [Anaerolineales bacterium]MCB8966875.1 cytochrome c oxidase assembly protein [Ardenticatenaceae bacterium]
MDPITRAALSSWDWRPEVIIVLALAGTLYLTGWRRLRQRTFGTNKRQQDRRQRTSRSHWHLAARWRPIVYVIGLLFIGLALMSPIDILAQQLFFMHMIQHLLLIMIAPPLLLIANPMPFMLWGLPARLRHTVGRAIGRLLHRESGSRRWLRSATAPGVIWMFWVISIIGWHDPNAYNAALRHEFVHDLEHLFFFAAGMLYWWHVTGAGPRIHKQIGLIGRIAFVLAAIPPNMALGVVLAFVSKPVYSYYTAVPRLWNISVIDDQRIGGVIMWVPGSMMYIIAALLLAARLFGKEEVKPALPEANWATKENLAVPGMKQ